MQSNVIPLLPLRCLPVLQPLLWLLGPVLLPLFPRNSVLPMSPLPRLSATEVYVVQALKDVPVFSLPSASCYVIGAPAEIHPLHPDLPLTPIINPLPLLPPFLLLLPLLPSSIPYITPTIL